MILSQSVPRALQARYDMPAAAHAQIVMRTDLFADVPSAIDLRSMAHARGFATTPMAKRLERDEFLGQSAHHLPQIRAVPCSLLELGSGPGLLPRNERAALRTSSYVGLDFSTAMHERPKQRLGC